MEQESLLLDIEYNPVIASVGKRFLNYLIDLIIFYFLIAFIIVILFINNRVEYSNYVYENSSSIQLVTLLTELILFIALYSLCEIIFKGRTIGKFITGTAVVNEDGTPISPKTAFLRSLYRIVPFEPFSAFGGRPWHDKWTHTFVVDVRKTAATNLAYQA